MIVTLCGSVRFESEFKEATRELGLRGISAFSLSVYPSDFTDEVRTERGAALDGDAVKVMLDLVHLEKILRSDAVLVVGDGYVGRSTARELIWANMLGKPIVTRRGSWDEVVRLLHGVEPEAQRQIELGLLATARRVIAS